MTQDARPLGGGSTIGVDILADQILCVEKIEGITISGGEPFLQTRALSCLIRKIREKRDIGVVVYTGYLLSEILALAGKTNGESTNGFLECIDILVDGLYVKKLDDGRSLRGSSNQVVHRLSERYSPELIRQYYGTRKRKVEIHIQGDDLMLAGIPGPEMLSKWKNRK